MEQDKDYTQWHKLKGHINAKERLRFHEREVWFCNLGSNIGSEQDGKGQEFLRPVVIVKKFNNEIFWGIPTTKSSKTGEYYYKFNYTENASTTALLSQLKLIDSKRLRYQIGFMRKIDFIEMKKRLTSFLK